MLKTLESHPNPRPQFDNPTQPEPLPMKEVYINIKFTTMIELIIKFVFALMAVVIIFYFVIIILSVAFPPLAEFFNAILVLSLLS